MPEAATPEMTTAKPAKVPPRRKQAKGLLRRCNGGLFLFVLLYNLLFRVVLVPLGRLVWTGALLLSPQSFFLMGSDPRDLLKSPLLLVAGLVLGVGYAFWALYEIAGILLYLDAGTRDEKLPLRPLLKTAFVRLMPVFKPKNLPLLLFTGVIVPLTDFVMVGDFISQLTVPTYIMEVITAKPLYLIGFTALMLVLVLWTIGWLFVFHRFILMREDLPAAAHNSICMVRGQGFKNLVLLLLYRLRVYVVYGIFAGIGILIFIVGVYFLQDYVDEALASAPLTLTYVLGPMFEFSSHCFVTFAQWAYITVLYREFRHLLPGEPADAPLPQPKFRLRALPVLMVAAFALAGCGGELVFLVAAGTDTGLQFLLDNRVAVSAHRGHSATAPENTLPAYLAAIDCGVADYGELDVQQTSDGVVVLTHDTNLKRCTGRNVNVYDITYDELQTLDASLGYSGPGDFTGTKIPTLDEVIKACKGKLKLNIEIKQNGHAPTLEEEVVRLIRENDFSEECVITSLNYPSLERVKELAPELKCGYILAVGVGQYYDLPACDFFSVETTFVTKGMVEAIHLRGKEVHCWTVDSTKDADRLIRLGVDNLITGDPEMAYAEITAEAASYNELLGLRGLQEIWDTAGEDAANAEAELTATPETAATLEDILDAA